MPNDPEGRATVVASIAHDINNLLTVIGASAQFALARNPADDSVRTCLAEISDAVAMAAGLTRQLREVGQGMLYDTGASVDSVIEGLGFVLRRLVGPGVELTLDLECNVRVRMPAGQLQRVLLNLVGNARDALPPAGGAIRVETRHVTAALQGGHYAAVTVVDTGCGIDEDTLPRVFEPFFTTKPHGSGIGLSTVHRLVAESGGRVAVESAPGLGTTFRVLLPVDR